MWYKMVLIVGAALTLLASDYARGQAAQEGKASSGMDMAGLIASALGAAAMAPPCMATPPCEACCMMMAQALAQIPASGGASGGATNAANAMSINGQSPQSGPNPDTYGKGLDPKIADAIKKAQDTAKAKGIKLDDKSISFNGKSYPLGADTSAAGLAALGFGKGDIQKALGIAAELNTSPTGHPSVGAAGGENVGGSSGSSGGSGDSNRKPAAAVDPNAGKKDVSLAGMAKRIGDDQIGVAADNIFKMITRRYNKEDSKSGFFEK